MLIFEQSETLSVNLDCSLNVHYRLEFLKRNARENNFGRWARELRK